MVAIPAVALLASSIISHLGPLTEPLNAAVRARDLSMQQQHSTAPTTCKTASSNPIDTDNAFGTVLGPVVDRNFPDPSIIYLDGVSYAFATNNRGVGGHMIHIQMATSTDNVTWTYLEGKDAMPAVAPWANGTRVWAPDVVRLNDGTFVMYFSDQPLLAPRHHCVSAATSKTIMGPYTPLSTPLACPLAQGGAIDPDGFEDVDGKRYIVYKVDGNSIGHGGMCMNTKAPIVPTPIILQEVGQDGVTLIGQPIEILDRDKLDGPLIEAPSLHRSSEGIYFLFYSSNCFSTPLYDTNYATSTSITGPYKRAKRPLFVTGDGPDLKGPGGTDIIKDGTYIVFHSHLDKTTPGQPGYTPRGMYTAELTFSGHTVSAGLP